MSGWSTISTFADKVPDAGKAGSYRQPGGGRQGETFLQRKCAECEQEELVQRKGIKDEKPLDLLQRLRDMSRTDAIAHMLDEDFMRELSETYKGAGRWSLFSVLFFGNQLPALQNELAMAFTARRITDAMDALALIILNHGVDTYAAREVYWRVLEDVVLDIFSGDPRLVDLYRMVIQHDVQSVMPTRLNFRSSQVHYEPDASGGARLEMQTNQARQTVYATTSEWRVIVTIYFVDGASPAQPYYFRGAGEAGLPDKWKSEIESVWNGRFQLDNGVHKLKVSVSPRYTFDRAQADQAVVIMNDTSKACRGQQEPGRSFENCWFTNASKKTIAHEFGHMLGAVDEYNLPGSEREIPQAMRNQLTRQELERTTYGGIQHMYQKPGTYTMPGLMGDMGSTEVKARHLQALVDAFNAGLPPGTPHYVIKKL